MTPFQTIHYLRFLINSRDENQDKVIQMVTLCREVQQRQFVSVQELVRLTATLPAICQAPLWYWELQRLRNLATQHSQSFDQPVALNQEAHLELELWCTKMTLVNGKSIQPQEPDLVMETDTSMQGWGAVCGIGLGHSTTTSTT